MTIKKRVIAGSAVAAAGIAGAGLAAGVALADPGPASPTPTPSASPQAVTGHGKHKGKHDGAIDAKHMLHGEFVTKAKTGYATFDTQRGSITAVSATSISLKSADGFTATYAVTADAKVRKNGAGATITEVKTGDLARVVASKNGSTLTVKGLVIGADKAKPGKPGKAAKPAN